MHEFTCCMGFFMNVVSRLFVFFSSFQPLIHKSLNLTAKPFVRCTYSPPTSVSYPDKKAKESSEFNNNNNNNNYLTSPPFSDKDYSLPNYVSSSYNSLPKCYGSVANDETNRAKELLTQQLAVMRIQPTLPPVRSANSTPLVSTPALPSSLTLNKCNSVSVFVYSIQCVCAFWECQKYCERVCC